MMISLTQFYKYLKVFKVTTGGTPPPADTLQAVYDASPTGEIVLASEKPLKMTGVDSSLVPAVVTEAEFDAITNPDSGLLTYDSGIDRYLFNAGTPGSPVKEHLAAISDIEALQEDVVYGYMQFKDNATATVIGVGNQNVYIKIAGTYLAPAGLQQEFSHVTGRLTYIGAATRVMMINTDCTATANLVNVNAKVALFKNGTLVSESESPAFLGPVSPSDQPVIPNTLISMSTGDYIEVFIKNLDSEDDLTVTKLGCIPHTIGGTAGGVGQFLEVAANLSDVANVINSGRNLGFTNGYESIIDNAPRTYTTATQPRYIEAAYTIPGGIITLCPFNVVDAPKVGDVFCIVKNTGTDPVDINRNDATTIITLAVGEIVQLIALDNSLDGDVLGELISGDGAGDLLAINNLSDVDNTVTSGRNLGFTEGVITLVNVDPVYITSDQPRFINLNYSAGGHQIALCPFNLADSPKLGEVFCSIRNIGTEPVSITDSSVGFLITISAGQSYEFRGTAATASGNILFESYKTITNGRSGSEDLISSDIDSSYSATNYTPTSANIDGYLEGIDNALATTPSIREVTVLGTTQTPLLTYPTGVWTTMVGVLNGTKTIPAGTFLVGQTVEIDICGFWTTTVNGSNSNLRILFGGTVLATTSNLDVTGFTGQRNWALKYKVTVTSPTTIAAAASGWYMSWNNVMRQFDLIVLPTAQPYNSGVNNDIDVEFNPNPVGGSTDFVATNLNIIKYN